MATEKIKPVSEADIKTNHMYAQVTELLKNLGLEEHLFPGHHLEGTQEGLLQLLEYLPTQLVAHRHSTEAEARQYKAQVQQLSHHLSQLKKHYATVEQRLQRRISALQAQNQALIKQSRKGTDIYPQ